jgi:hypothetical protein
VRPGLGPLRHTPDRRADPGASGLGQRHSSARVAHSSGRCLCSPAFATRSGPSFPGRFVMQSNTVQCKAMLAPWQRLSPLRACKCPKAPIRAQAGVSIAVQPDQARFVSKRDRNKRTQRQPGLTMRAARQHNSIDQSILRACVRACVPTRSQLMRAETRCVDPLAKPGCAAWGCTHSRPAMRTRRDSGIRCCGVLSAAYARADSRHEKILPNAPRLPFIVV